MVSDLKLFQAPRSVLSLPVNVVFFIDSPVVIKHYASFKLNAKLSKIESYELLPPTSCSDDISRVT